MRIIVLCVLFLAYVHSQDILSVSSFESCFTVSVNGLKLTCSQTSEIATTLDLRVTPSETQETDEVFTVNLSTLPPDSLSTQVQTGNKCQIATSDDKCQTTPNTIITVTASKPVLQYSLSEFAGTYTHPFSVPYAYYFLQTQTASSSLQSTAKCVLTKTATTTMGSTPPTSAQIENDFNDPTRNAARIRCGSNAQVPDDGASATATNVLQNTFTCYNEGSNSGEGVTVTSEFLPIQPQCTVFQVNNPPKVVSRVTVTVTNAVGTQTIELDSLDNTAGVSSDGRVIARIEDVQSPSGNFGDDLTGLVVVCTDSDDVILNMAPENQPIGTNPFKFRETVDGLFNASNRYPTPATIAQLIQTNTKYSMWYFVNRTTSPAVGENCGQLGVNPNIYAAPPQDLFFEYYLTTLFTSSNEQTQAFEISYSALQNLGNLLTCVQGFGFPYLDISVDTPCSAMDKFNTFEQNGDPSLRENLPVFYNPKNPNMWLDGTKGNYLYYEPPPRDLAFEVILNFAGSFVSVGAKVPTGKINEAASACTLSTDPSACGTITNANSTSCAIHVQVCNPSTTGVSGNYLLSTTCQTGSNVVPVGSAAGISVLGVAADTCVNIIVPLAIIGNVDATTTPACDCTLFSNEGSVDPNTVILWETTFECVVSDMFVLPPSGIAPNLTIAPGTQPPPPPGGGDGSSNLVMTIAIVIAAIVLAVVVLEIIWLTCLRLFGKVH